MSGLTEVSFEGFVHAESGRLVDGQGRPLLLRGVGLGNWLLPEGYMWRFPREAPQSPRHIESLITDLVGEAASEAFWRGFREAFITEADIAAIASDGFDHVRLPLSARLLIDDEGRLRREGLIPIDRLIEWCRRHRLWVILDLHGAPGGQTGSNIDDSQRGLPDLFILGGRYRELTVELWTQLAARYRSEMVVAGYDLLNEPLPDEYGEHYASDLVSLYQDLTAAIRTVDPDHLLVYEGTHWSTDWSIFTEVWDANSMLQFHKYWSAPDRPSIAAFIERGRELSLPIYMGEGGENDLAWIQTAFGLYEDLGISWNFWPWKKLDTWTSPVSVVPPEDWTGVVDYASGAGARPTAAKAQRILDGLLKRVRFSECEPRPDVVRALFHRAPITLSAEAFSFGGAGVSYQTHQAESLEWFRSDDRVTIRCAEDVDPGAAFDPVDAPPAEIGDFEVVLGEGDWVGYSVEVAAPTRLRVEVDTRVGDPDRSRPAAIELDGKALLGTDDAGRFHAVTTDVISPGRHAMRIQARYRGTVIRSVRIVPD